MKLDRGRLLRFVFAFAALSACWSREDGDDPSLAHGVARMAERCAHDRADSRRGSVVPQRSAELPDLEEEDVARRSAMRRRSLTTKCTRSTHAPRSNTQERDSVRPFFRRCGHPVRMRSSAASRRGRYWGMTIRPGLCCDCTNSAKCRGMVSFRPARRADGAVLKSTAGRRLATADTMTWFRSASAWTRIAIQRVSGVCFLASVSF